MLVMLRLNNAAKNKMISETGACPSDTIVCLGESCGAMFHALTHLQPLQALIK